MIEHVTRRGERFRVGLSKIRDGLTDRPAVATAAAVRFLTADGDDAGGPYPGVFDSGYGGWIVTCPARTEAVGTRLTRIESVTVSGVAHESTGITRVIA